MIGRLLPLEMKNGNASTQLALSLYAAIIDVSLMPSSQTASKYLQLQL